MVIPKYIQEMMSRAAFDRVYLYGGDPGYTIKIRKASTQTYARTLEAECNRLVAWANRSCPTPGTAVMLHCPTVTRYHKQAAFVTIYDPVMKALEPYIADNF